MSKRFFCRIFTHFLCLSLLFLVSGFSGRGTDAEARDRDIPIGEMVSKGDVRFEARENQWKNVESSYFPVFQGIKFKTEKGVAVVSLLNNSRVELGPDSIVSFEQSNRLDLSRGNIDFRISPASETSIRVRDLSITLPHFLQISNGASGTSAPKQETIGSISIHPNGAVTVRSLQGSLSVLGQNRTVLAALSSKDMVTIPALISSGSQKLAGDTGGDKKGPPPAGAAAAGAALVGAAALAGAAGAATETGMMGLSILVVGGVETVAATGIVYESKPSPREQTPSCCPLCPQGVLSR